MKGSGRENHQAAFFQNHREGDEKEAWFRSHPAGREGPLKVFTKQGRGWIRVLLKGLVIQRDRIREDPGGLGRG